MPDIAVKICGLTSQAAVDAALDGDAQYLGFVFYPASPRHIAAKKAADLTRNIPPSVQKVAVVVDATDEELQSIADLLQPDYFQLHGNESLERVAEIKTRFETAIIKAIKIRNADDVALAGRYQSSVDMLLFDARAPETSATHLPGGNGLSFDWMLLQGRQFAVPWMLSGGLNAANVADAVSISGANMLDVSSSLEGSPGVKDSALIKKFLQAVAAL